MRASVRKVANFYSHASYEAWRRRHCCTIDKYLFLLTRLIRGMTGKARPCRRYSVISTHTPHTRHDGLWCVYDYGIIHFYSHASYEAWLGNLVDTMGNIHFYSHASYEAWQLWAVYRPFLIEFLLTRLIRGMTAVKRKYAKEGQHFYSHASYEAWHDSNAALQNLFQFLLTRLIRGMTEFREYTKEDFLISTHTPHTRHDCSGSYICTIMPISTHTPHTRHDWFLRIPT